MNTIVYPPDDNYLSAVRRIERLIDTGSGVTVEDVRCEVYPHNTVPTRNALNRLAAAGKLTKTVNGKKAARYRVRIRPEIIRAMFTSDDSDLPDVPAPDGSRMIVVEEPPTPPEILDPDVLRPEDPVECAGKPIKPITKNRDTALGRELWDEVEEASRECRERSLRKPWTVTLDHPTGGTATFSSEEPAECTAGPCPCELRTTGPGGCPEPAECGVCEECSLDDFVCDGCGAQGEEPCRPGCKERDDDPDAPDPCDSWLPDVRQSADGVSTTTVALTPIKAQQIIRREQRLRFTRDERVAELREAVRVLRALADVGEGLIVEVGR